MGNKRVGKYPEAFRRMAVERMRDCANVSALARELEIDRTVLYHWQRLAVNKGRTRQRRLAGEGIQKPFLPQPIPA